VTAARSTGEVHSGFVALVGRPNAGKSTLANALVGCKVAIVSDKPQTTRHRLRAIVDTDDAQIVLVDTPGLHKPQDALGEELNRSALLALRDVDVVAMVVDLSQPVGGGDRWVATHVAATDAKRVLVLTKADLPDRRPIEERISDAAGLLPFDDVVVLSAKEGFNLEGFTAVVGALLPMGPRFFPEGMTSDQPEEVLISELIREKVLCLTRDEVPHSVGLVVDDIRYDEGNKTTTVSATVFVERKSQQGIVVGSGGSLIKRIGTEARKDLETLLGTKVYLDLAVRVKKDWRSDGAMIERFGYGEGL
jgi:GTP-binding protein Era